MAFESLGIGAEDDVGGRVVGVGFIASEPSRCWDVGKRTSSVRRDVIRVMPARCAASACQAPMPRRINWPGLEVDFGLLAKADARGVPVEMTSPGCRLMNWLGSDDLRHVEHHGAGVAVLVAVAVHFSQRLRFCTSPTSSAVTSQGPRGPKVSQPFALVPLRAALQLPFAFRSR